MSSSYSMLLAEHYDQLQHELDYAFWAKEITALDLQYNLRKSADGEQGKPLLLDCGCGTGRFLLEMQQCGYDIMGFDDSVVMLQQAQLNLACGTGLVLHQSMMTFELYGTVDLITCNLDTVNHLTDIADVKSWLKSVVCYLNEGGVLIFDLATQYHFATTLAQNSFVFSLADDAGTMIWHNEYDSDTATNVANLEWYMLRADNLYARFDEQVVERYYEHQTLSALAIDVGLEPVALLGDDFSKILAENDERRHYVWRKPVGMKKK